MKTKLYRCSTCGLVVMSLGELDERLSCCGSKMVDVNPNVSELEDIHLPMWKVKGCKVFVQIGANPHPMDEDHYIEWIALRTNKRFELRMLKPKDKVRALFFLGRGEKVEEVYAFCNIHALWRSSSPVEPCPCKRKAKKEGK